MMKIVNRVAAILLTLATLAACIGTVKICTYAMNASPQLLESKTTPEAVVDAYFAHITAREFEAADLLLSSEVMTLNSEPDSEVGALLYDALWDTFTYTRTAPAVTNNLQATQTVQVTYLDIPAVTALQRTHMRAALEQLADQAEDPDALLDEEGYYNMDISLEALKNVTASLLENPDRFMVTKEFTLELEFINYEWKIIANEDLYTVLSGNTY